MMTLTVINSDGRRGTPSEQDAALLSAAQALLQAEAHFHALTSPTLSRCEVNAGLSADEPGYLYLRYDVAGAVPQEFWAHWGTRDRVAWKSGQITVQAHDPKRT